MNILTILTLLIFIDSCSIDIKNQKYQQNKVTRSVNKSEYELLKSKSYTHPLLTAALKDVEIFYSNRQQDIAALSGRIVALTEKKKLSKTILRNKIKAQLAIELQYIINFNKKTAELIGYDPEDLTIDPNNSVLYPVKFNKIHVFLKHAMQLSDSALDSIIDGKFIKEISHDTKFPSADIFSDNRSNLTIPSTLMVMLSALRTLDENEYDLYIETHKNDTAFLYWYKTPPNIDMDHKSILYRKDKDSSGILIVHNGYAFGDSYNNTDYSDRKFHIFPHDCSGYITHLVAGFKKDKLSGVAYVMWTMDIYNLYRFLLKSENFVNYDLIRVKLPLYGVFADKLYPVVLNEISDIKEGDILFYRKFVDFNQNDNLGSGGHTGVVVGTDGVDKIYIINYARNYEDMQTGGFMLSGISLGAIKGKNFGIGLFRYKEQHQNVHK